MSETEIPATPPAPATDRGTFARYVEERERNFIGGLEEHRRYAFGGDLAMLRGFRRAAAVESVVRSIVKANKAWLRNGYLGTTVLVGPKQLPRIHHLAKECAHDLGIPMPTLYVANSPFMNAFTFGTDDDSFVVVHSKLVDDFSDAELKFVIGHEMGHIQNGHVVYGTALRLMKGQLSLLFRFIAPPLEAALRAWSRRAEVTCDRAGLLCSKDLDAACGAFMKMACGSSKLYDEMDLDAYVAQLEASQKGVGRFRELLASHPYLPKRIKALRLFAESSLYRSAAGLGPGGRDLKEIDEEVGSFIKVIGQKRAGEDGAASEDAEGSEAS